MSGWPEFLQIIVPGVPVPKGRPRVSTYMTKRGNRITRARTPERTRNFEAQVALYARSKMARLPILHGPVAVHVDCRFALPVGGTGLEKQHDRDVGWHCGRPDADNVAKAVVDAPGSHSWSQGVGQLLIGQDPRSPQRLLRRRRQRTACATSFDPPTLPETGLSNPAQSRSIAERFLVCTRPH